MHELIQYFTNISDEVRGILLLGGLTFFLLLESGVPLFRMNYNKWKHAGINLTFTVITLTVNLFGAALILATVRFNEANNTGLLNIIELPPWVYIIGGLIFLDLIGAWLIHWIEHKVKWLWKFHLIHHTDPNVDVTSGLRHHPGENIFRLLFTSLAVFITGASFGLVMMYQTISAFFAHFSHANIKMPLAVDKAFATIFVTPHFHKVHHHFVQPHTDSNYGNIFSIWDRLFRTTTYVNKMDDLVYGIDTHMKPSEHSSLKNLLMIPFQKYRPPVGSKFGS
ncbi:MAG: sterol desaturase family protein [Candidatus Marinimicrobia bacterium]|nr:sterol desaturase family protein [Candidatus Neomarinimicrobiota bacterium]